MAPMVAARIVVLRSVASAWRPTPSHPCASHAKEAPKVRPYFARCELVIRFDSFSVLLHARRQHGDVIQNLIIAETQEDTEAAQRKILKSSLANQLSM